MSRVNVGKENVVKKGGIGEIRRSIFRELFGVVLFLCWDEYIIGKAKKREAE